MSRNLIAYTGAGSGGKQAHRAQACFNHTEDYGLIHILYLQLFNLIFNLNFSFTS